MKEEIKLFADGAEIRFLDTRILMKKYPNGEGYMFEFHRIIKGRRWKTARTKRLRKCKVVTAIRLSEKAVMGILQSVVAINNVKK